MTVETAIRLGSVIFMVCMPFAILLMRPTKNGLTKL